MDQLNNINANDGFPLCAETLQVLYDNAVLANRMLSGLRLSNNTAIILHEYDAVNNIHSGYAYVYTSQGGNRIVKYARSTSVQFSSAKMIITSTSQNVSVNQHTYQNVYVTESAIIGTENTDANKWKFYWLNEVIEPAMFEDKTMNISYGSKSDNIQFGSQPSLIANGSYFSRNANKIRLKLAISVNATSFDDYDYFYFNIGSNNVFNLYTGTGNVLSNPTIIKQISNVDVYPLKSSIKISSNIYDIESYLFNERVYFKIGKMAKNNLTENQGGTYSANGTIYVNSEVLL